MSFDEEEEGEDKAVLVEEGAGDGAEDGERQRLAQQLHLLTRLQRLFELPRFDRLQTHPLASRSGEQQRVNLGKEQPEPGEAKVVVRREVEQVQEGDEQAAAAPCNIPPLLPQSPDSLNIPFLEGSEKRGGEERDLFRLAGLRLLFEDGVGGGLGLGEELDGALVLQHITRSRQDVQNPCFQRS